MTETAVILLSMLVIFLRTEHRLTKLESIINGKKK